MADITPKAVVLLPSSTLTASGTGAQMPVYRYPFSKARVRLKYAAGTGTTPTLNVYIQKGMSTAAASDASGAVATGAIEWQDLIAFAQATTSAGTQYAEVVEAGNVVQASKDASLTAGSVANGPLGTWWRVKYVIAGTNPSYATVTVTAELIP